MATKNDNDFHIKLGDIKLSDDARRRVQKGIQEVILKELADHFPNPDDDDKKGGRVGSGVLAFPPKHWWGLIIHQVGLENIKLDGLKDDINSLKYGS